MVAGRNRAARRVNAAGRLFGKRVKLYSINLKYRPPAKAGFKPFLGPLGPRGKRCYNMNKDLSLNIEIAELRSKLRKVHSRFDSIRESMQLIENELREKEIELMTLNANHSAIK
jgi:hypothetical protein